MEVQSKKDVIINKFAALDAGGGGGSSGGCSTGGGVDLVNIPTWYKYLDCPDGSPQINHINDVWSIGLGIIEIIVFVASIAAVFYLVYGGIQFATSQGSPDKTVKAKQTLTYAIAGLVIAMISRAVVQFIGGEFGATL